MRTVDTNIQHPTVHSFLRLIEQCFGYEWIQKGTITFYFINDGIESALQKAKKSANDNLIPAQALAAILGRPVKPTFPTNISTT